MKKSVDYEGREVFYSPDGYFWAHEEPRRPTRPPTVNEIVLEVKPPCGNYSYSNPASQGALIAETSDFPFYLNKITHECHSAYSDRLCSWDSKHFDRLCALIGGGDQVWAYRLWGAGDQRLKEIAQFAFHMDELPGHVRVIHYYNVSSGYSCPVIVAIARKKKDPKKKRKIVTEIVESHNG